MRREMIAGTMQHDEVQQIGKNTVPGREQVERLEIAKRYQSIH